MKRSIVKGIEDFTPTMPVSSRFVLCWQWIQGFITT